MLSKAEKAAARDAAARAKRELIATRESAWRALSSREQLAALDQRLGKGVGARKQRVRIARAITAGGGR